MKETDVYFDDVEINDLNIYLLERHEHPLLASTRDMSTNIPGTNGSHDFGADLDTIPFNLPLGIHQKNKAEVQQVVRQLKSVLLDGDGKPKTFQLKFGYEPDKYYNVRYSGFVPIDRLVRTGEFFLPLTCYEGRSWSVVKNDEVNWWSEEINWYSAFTWEHKGDGAKTFTSPGSTEVTVTGYNLRPILHVSGTGSNVNIVIDGKTLNLGTFTNASWEINLEEFEVTKDGISALGIINELNPDGEWLEMKLLQGDNIITVSGSGLNLNFSVEFRDRYF